MEVSDRVQRLSCGGSLTAPPQSQTRFIYFTDIQTTDVAFRLFSFIDIQTRLDIINHLNPLFRQQTLVSVSHDFRVLDSSPVLSGPSNCTFLRHVGVFLLHPTTRGLTVSFIFTLVNKSKSVVIFI